MSDINSNNYDNSNGNSDKKKRRNKKLLFDKERNEILEKLISLINFNNDNTILFVQLQDNLELKKYLNNNIDNIKKYYRCSSWGYFVSLNNGEKGDEIVLLKAIFKDHGYIIFSKDITSEYNNVKKRYTKLFFTK
jgi:hypothetical protein